MTQPQALRLAEDMERPLYPHYNPQAAAELRRLHAQRDELLAALKMLVLATKDFSIGHYNEEVHDIALSKALAAIKQTEENT